MQPLRLLLIEPDMQASERLTGTLESAGHDVLPVEGVTDAQEALEVQRFDAVMVTEGTIGSDLVALRSRLANVGQRTGSAQTPIVSVIEPGGTVPEQVDAVLTEPLQPLALSDAVHRLAKQAGSSVPSMVEQNEESIFDPVAFEEQMAGDVELMQEILDIYFTESARQREEMAEALNGGEMRRLSEIAHTIKGSLGSLHAAEARMRAQDLELAAKAGDVEASTASLPALERELHRLEPVLQQLRDRIQA